MNESMSILLATSLLALGGIGLYMFKSPDTEQTTDGESSGSSFFGGMWGDNDEESVTEESVREEEDVVDDEPIRKRNITKTPRNKKSTGTAKRRNR